MSDWDLHLFLLINASAHPAHWSVVAAGALATWLIWLVPLLCIVLWLRGSLPDRRDLAIALAAVAIALSLAQGVGIAWPHARPFAQHIGHQLLAHEPDPGFPSDHAIVFFTLGFALLRSRRWSWIGLPLLAAGMLVGWARVYLGVHFPFDIIGAVPVAVVSSFIAAMLERYIDMWLVKPLHRWTERHLRRRLAPSVQH